ncbi:glycerophosphodiester phosphodiesterase [Streptomyces sp. NPDC050658]|uniref:glycerophosphodiester phosphodiesterase n=1 Tax=unclassified Streptomyces TaxID=2593676 RepID=UPI00343DBCFD
MKLRSRFPLPSMLTAALAVALCWTGLGSWLTTASAPHPTFTERPSPGDEATFTLDESAGSRRITGGAAEGFTARLSGGAELGVAGQTSRLRYQSSRQEHLTGTIDSILVPGRHSTVDCSATHTIGHRGAPEIAPENTIDGMKAADDHGAEWVEMDVQFTKDGRPVIMHDDTVDRMTDGTGRVDELTAKEIAGLTVKGGGRVPTLKQVLSSLQSRSVRLLLEIKGPQPPAAVKRVLRLVAKADMTQRTMLQSFDKDVLRDAAKSARKTEIALLRTKLDPDPVATARKFSLSTYSVKFRALSARPTVVKQLKAAGIKVFVWTVDRAADWPTATSWGVDGIITNRPVQFLKWKKAHCTPAS